MVRVDFMPQPTFLSISEHVAEHLSGEILSGCWGETIPGLPTLAAKLGVNFKTVEVALDLLENQGLLLGQGTGRPRRIVLPAGMSRPYCGWRSWITGHGMRRTAA